MIPLVKSYISAEKRDMFMRPMCLSCNYKTYVVKFIYKLKKIRQNKPLMDIKCREIEQLPTFIQLATSRNLARRKF